MKTKSRLFLIVFLMALVMLVGAFAVALVPVSALTAFAAGGTGTKDDPVICSTYSEFKAAMEDSNIRYVELKNCNEVLPKISGEGLISAINVTGIKHLSLTGNNVFTVSADSDGYKSYDSLLHLVIGSTMTVEGGGSLTFKANLSNGRNAVIYNQGGSIAIYNGTLKGSYNTAVYGMAIWQDSGDLEIIDGSFISDSAISNNNPKYSVYLGGGSAWIRGGSFTSVNTSNTQAPLYGLCIETGAIVDISGGEFDGILLPTDTTPMSNYVQNYKTVLVNESPIDATSANCQALVGSGNSVRIVELIKEIKINTETPMAGMNISDLPITLGGGYSLAMYYPQWYKNEEYVSSGTFEQGANYSVVLRLERNKTYNYEFASNVTATVNGEAVVVDTISGLNKSQFVEITYNFGICCDVIDTVNLNVPTPVEHQTHGAVTRPYGVTSYSVNYTYWYMSDTGADGTWVSMPDVHQFTAGKYYKVSVDVKASDGYLFKVNRDLDPDITGNINGYSADVSRVYEQSADEYVCLTYNFGVCNDSVIEKIVIDNITAPVAGETPSYSLSVQGSAYKSEGDYGFDTKNGVQWTDVTNENAILYDYTKFIPGHTYQVKIYLHAEENYTFATTGGENYPATTATVNGNAATVVNNSNSSKYQTVTYEFVCPKKNISSFEINDLAIPQADAAPDTSATTPYPEYYAVESITWYNPNKTQMEANAKFEEGKSYLVEVKLVPGSLGASAITFSNNPDAFINGEKVYTLSEWDEIEIRLGAIYVRYTFPTIPLSETPVNSYMVSYYPGEAEGSPDSDMVDEGTEITLAECNFTAPSGMKFKAWAIGSLQGEQKQPGDEITITEETYIYAVWEDLPTFIVAYAPGEGVGSTEYEYVTTGTTVTLLTPTDAYLGYEAPEGKLFAHWRVCEGNAQDPNAVIKKAGEEITITYDIYIIAVWNTIIYSVDINGIIAPVDGEIHDISTITVNTEGILGFEAIQWCKSSSNTVLNPGVAFVAGQSYYLNIKFEVAEGYVLNRSGSPYHGDITINAEAPYTSMSSMNNFFFHLKYTAANLPVVSFDANGGGGEMTAIPDVKGDYELPACSFTAPTDHYFKAWAIGAVDGPQKKAGETITISSDTTLYAIWGEYTTINTVNITGIIAPVDGEIHDISTITVNTEGILGFEAIQWCKSSSNTVLNPGVAYIGGQAYHLNIKFALAEGYRLNTLSNSPIHADITINADAPFASMASKNNFFFHLNYTATNPSTVSFDANGGTGSMAPAIDQYGPYELPSCAFTAPSEKQFKAWAIGSLEGEQKAPGEQITVTDDIVIYAIWKDIPVATGITASYNGTILAGNTLAINSLTVKLQYSDSSEMPCAGLCTYWYNGSQIQNPISYVFGEELIGNLTITVKYQGFETTFDVQVVGYEITFNANGGTGVMAGDELIGEYTLPTCTFTAPSGKKFKGWATSASGEVIGATYTLTANVEFFAIWEDIPHTHSYGSVWEKDANNHWNECACGDKANEGAHVDANTDGTCDTCGWVDPNFTPIVPGSGEGGQGGSTPAPTPDNTPEIEGEEEAGLSGGAIAGIAVGATAGAVGLGAGGFAIFWFVVKKKSLAELLAIFKKAPKATPNGTNENLGGGSDDITE